MIIKSTQNKIKIANKMKKKIQTDRRTDEKQNDE